MKLSITLTLATIASMCIGSEARIGGGEKYEIYVSNTCHNDVTAREQNKNQGSVVKASSCKLWDSGTTESLQSFVFDTQSNKAGTGSVQCQKKPNPYECQQFMMHKKLPDNACVIKVPSSMCDDRKLEDDTTAASGNSTYTVFVAVKPSIWSVGTKAGLIDEYDKSPISAIDVGGDVTCAQVGVGIISDEVSYFIIEHPGSGDFVSSTANCADIGNSNNDKCQLPDGTDLPDNACVILG